MRQQCQSFGVEIWSYGLMPNHTYLIAVPEGEKGLFKGIGEAHWNLGMIELFKSPDQQGQSRLI